MSLNSGISELVQAQLAYIGGPIHIEPGCHYMAANFGYLPIPNVGLVYFHGDPIGPGNTDTVYRRLERVSFPDQRGLSATIPIELVSLNVKSIKPVTINGRPHDMKIKLTKGQRSIGEMSIRQEFGDSEKPLPRGTFHKNIHIYFTAEFTETNTKHKVASLDFEHHVYIATVHSGSWSTVPWPGMVVINEGPEELQTTNFFIYNSIYMLTNDIGRMMAGGSKMNATY